MNACGRPVIELSNVAVTADGEEILRVESLVIEGPGIAQLLGPNGSGKTTLLRTIAGLTRARGSVRVCGVEVAGDPGAAGRLVAYTPQDAPAKATRFPVTPREVLEAALRLRGEEGDVEAALEAVGLEREYWEQPLGELSGGSRQKVFLARSLLLRRPVLLLDEPFSALDPASRLRAVEAVSSAADDSLVVVSSHDPELLMDKTRVIVLLSEGRVAAVGRPGEVLRIDVLERVYGGLAVEVGGHIHIREGH